jgi:hypothetical protein
MRPLIEYYNSAADSVVSNVKSVDWIRVGKLIICVPIAVVWTPTFFVIENVYKGCSWFNVFGGEIMERFLND